MRGQRSGVAPQARYGRGDGGDQRREERWTRGWLQGEVERRAGAPAERLLAIFDVFGEWFARDDFEGCSFINVLLELGEPGHPVREASVRHLTTIRGYVADLAEAAGVPASEADAFARQWHILMKGSIVAAAEGDREAAARARELGSLLLAHRGVAERAGTESWLVAGLEPAIERAVDAGEARQAGHPELPLDDDRLHRRIHHLVTACGLVLALPGLVAIARSGLPWETMLLAFAVATLAGIDVAVLGAVIVATWRGWMPLPDDGGSDDDPDPDPAPPP